MIRTNLRVLRVRLIASFLAVAASSLVSTSPAAEGPGQPAAVDPYEEVLRLEYGRPLASTAAVEAEIRGATPEGLRAIEARLLRILATPGATRACKDWVCRQLRHAGSEEAAPALVQLLADRDLHTVARLALQGISGASVDRLLRESLTGLPAELKAGAILTIGARRDREAVAVLAPLASDASPGVAEAALHALGRIGGVAALRAVKDARVPAELERSREHARILCAESLVEEDSREALDTYTVLHERAGNPAVRIAALRGMARCAGAGSAPALLAALSGPSPELLEAAVQIVREARDPRLLAAVLADLGALPSDAQVLLLGVIDDPAAAPFLLRAARAGDVAIRAAAIGALGRAGDAATVPRLLELAAGGKDPTEAQLQSAARDALRRLRGKDVGAALEASVSSGAPAARAEAIRALASRGSVSAAGAILAAAGDPDPTIQTEALAALAIVGDTAALPSLMKMMALSGAQPRRAAVLGAVAAICRRAEDKDAAATALLAALPGAAVDLRCAILGALGSAAGPKALGALRAAMDDAESAVRDTAIGALASWPDPAAMGDLLAAARASRQPAQRQVLLAAMARLASAPGAVPPAERRVEVLADALKLAGNVEEKRTVLAGLAEVKDSKALGAAVSCLAEAELEVDAASAVVKVAAAVRKSDPEAADAAVQKILDVCKSPTARQIAESVMFVPSGLMAIAAQGKASSPDDLEKDGQAGGDEAAIDGDPATYWDEEDGKGPYRLVVTLPQTRKIAALTIMGWEHHQYAPRDFEILCDGVSVKKVEGAQYSSNFLVIRLDDVPATTIELKITGYYGGSPAIRELGIYRRAPARQP